MEAESGEQGTRRGSLRGGGSEERRKAWTEESREKHRKG